MGKPLKQSPLFPCSYTEYNPLHRKDEPNKYRNEPQDLTTPAGRFGMDSQGQFGDNGYN